jgi:hypothetical protein
MTTGIIVIFVIFILLQREDLRNRLIKLAGSHDLQKTTAALDDAARRLSRLFLTQLTVNAAFGLVIGTGLWVIGVPSFVLWGILAAIPPTLALQFRVGEPAPRAANSTSTTRLSRQFSFYFSRWRWRWLVRSAGRGGGRRRSSE